MTQTDKVTPIDYDPAMPYVGVGYAYPTSEIGGINGGYYTYRTAGGSTPRVPYGDLYPTLDFGEHIVWGLLTFTAAKHDRYCMAGKLRAKLLGTGNNHAKPGGASK